MPFIGQNSPLIIHSDAATAEQGAELLQSLVVRIALMLPYRARFTFVDPAGAGLAFPMRRHLPHVRENSGDARRDLEAVRVDIQRVIEGYLDASTKSFELVPTYIRSNERFQFVFAADFPNHYDRLTVEALEQIARTGPAAGVYLFIHYNSEYPLPRDVNIDEFPNCGHLDLNQTTGLGFAGVDLELKPDPAPAPQLQSDLFGALRQARPIEHLLAWDEITGKPELNWWSEDADKRIETPIGAHGSGDPLSLWFGVNSEGQPCAHGMLGAMTGSGKSNLYHVLITGLAVRYSPHQLRFYLIDGKDGVEFQPYRHLPHAEVVSLRSSPELSRSVLAELVDEKERRNALFARNGVNDFSNYRQSERRDGPLPRLLLLVDEYQQLFDGDQDGAASNLLRQLAEQGRSAGIHMFLASQRFGAAGMLDQTGTFGNMHLRVAMQMTASDVQRLSEFGRQGKALIAACDLPGKIVVNDRSGEDNANVAGKAAFIKAERRAEVLGELNRKADQLPEDQLPNRVVFDGSAQPLFIDNPAAAHLLRAAGWPSSQAKEAMARKPAREGGLGIADWFAAEGPSLFWLGQEFSVRGQARAILRRRAAEHMVITGGIQPARYGMLCAAVLSLALTTGPDQGEFMIIDRGIGDTRWSEALKAVSDLALTPAGFKVRYGRDNHDLSAVLTDLLAEIDRRRGLDEAELLRQPTMLVVLSDLDRVDAFRRRIGAYGLSDSERGPDLARLYVEGAQLGIHLLLGFGGVRLLTSVIDERAGLPHFRHRVALQMSEDESFTFVRSRRAAVLQSGGSRPIRALYLDVERDQTTQFKPYSTEAEGVEGDASSMIEQARAIGEVLRKRSARP